MNNLSWRGIRAFIYVAECGSFTSAAEAMGASKANVSQLVSELESSLGVQLLYRTTRQLRLTEIGDGYFRKCKEAMLQLDAAAEWAQQTTSEIKGRIHMNSVGWTDWRRAHCTIGDEFSIRLPERRSRARFLKTSR